MKKILLFSFTSILLSFPTNVFSTELTNTSSSSMTYDEGFNRINQLIKNSDFKSAEELIRIYTELEKTPPGKLC